MSATQETNNQNRAPTSDSALINASAQYRTRDPNYYYDTDSAVFLVEDVLFKLPKSNLLSHMDEESHPTANITRSDIERSGKWAGDSDPFFVSGVTAQQFRWFLLLLLGTPADPEYETLFMSTKSLATPTKVDFLCRLGIYIITRYFGMSKLHDWSYSQLEAVLILATGFVNTSWDQYTVMQAAACAYESDDWLSYDLHAFLLLALSTLAPNHPLECESPPSSNLVTCVALYKDPNLPQIYPELFGYVFTVILSLGRRSSVWTSQLTREDRTVLYAAQIDLTSLADDPDLELSWLSQPPSENWGGYCSESCIKDADTAWSASFAHCGAFDSVASLVDISKLVLLPGYRQIYIDSVQSSPNPCPCDNEVVLSNIDDGIEAIFITMCHKYKYFVENA